MLDGFKHLFLVILKTNSKYLRAIFNCFLNISNTLFHLQGRHRCQVTSIACEISGCAGAERSVFGHDCLGSGEKEKETAGGQVERGRKVQRRRTFSFHKFYARTKITNRKHAQIPHKIQPMSTIFIYFSKTSLSLHSFLYFIN